MIRTTIGARLTLWGTGMIFSVALALCLILYQGIRYSLLREVDVFLGDEHRELTAKVIESKGDLSSSEASIRAELSHRSHSDLVFRLLGADGRVLMVTEGGESLGLHPDPDEARLDLPESGRRRTISPTSGGVPFRSLMMPLNVEGERCAAEVLYSLDTVEHSLAMMRLISGAALVVTALLSWFGGRILARRSLHPVHEMTETARQIGGEGLTDRLLRSGTGDELDRLAETLNQMLDRIRDHVDRITQFTADASHELRTPLTALRVIAEVALTKPRSSEELCEMIAASVDEYDRLQALAESLLLLARGDSGISIVKCEVSLSAVVRDVAELYGPVAEREGLVCVGDVEQEVTFWGDGAILRQMLGNIVDNAIKYGRGGGPEVRLGLTSDGETVRITCSDQGVGVPPDELPRLFDRFYRGRRSRTTPGTGLGLAICQWIARAHGGTISVTRVVPHGTSVLVELPVGLSVPDGSNLAG